MLSSCRMQRSLSLLINNWIGTSRCRRNQWCHSKLVWELQCSVTTLLLFLHLFELEKPLFMVLLIHKCHFTTEVNLTLLSAHLKNSSSGSCCQFWHLCFIAELQIFNFCTMFFIIFFHSLSPCLFLQKNAKCLNRKSAPDSQLNMVWNEQ